MSLPDPAYAAPDPHALVLRHDDDVPVLELPVGLDFEALRALLREGMPELMGRIAGRSLRLDIRSRAIALFDLRRLVSVLRDEFAISTTGLYARPQAVRRFAERELKLMLFDPPVSAPDPEGLQAEPGQVAPEAEGEQPDLQAEGEQEVEAARLSEPEADLPEPPDEPPPIVVAPQLAQREAEAPLPTLWVHRTLRSGASVRYDGNVVVMGDVNPGAQVVAAGNVTVLGALKGVAHAGAHGEGDTWILAFDLRPTQLRIGRRIAIPPDRDQGAPVETEIARIVGEHVVIEPYRR